MPQKLIYLLSSLAFFLIGLSYTYAVTGHQTFATGSILTEWRFNPGDSAIYSSPSYSDTAWVPVSKRMIPRNPQGIKWIRSGVHIDEGVSQPVIFTIRDLQSAYEVYWDGEMVARNGKIGSTRQEEQTGSIFLSVVLDNALAYPGDHVLAIRYSDYSSLNLGNYNIYPTLSYSISIVNIYNQLLPRFLIVFAIGFTITLTGLALYFGGGMFKPYLYFAFIPAPYWIIAGSLSLVYVFNMPSYMAGIKPIAQTGLATFTDLLIGLFFLNHVKIKRKFIHLGIMVSLVIMTFVSYRLFPGFFILFYLALLCYCLVILVMGIRRKIPGTWLILTGYLAYITGFILVNSIPIPSIIIYDVCQLLLIILILFSVSLQLRSQTKEQQELQAKASRLELEILKKAIQPHFLMNTLASLQSLSKRDEVKADRMTQAIASEYRIINEVMSKKLIELSEEIELINQHLNLMGFRREAIYQLVVDAPDTTLLVPPMIFHTLVENGLTHSMKQKENGTFWLSVIYDKKGQCLILKNNGSLIPGQFEFPHSRAREGTGFKYIRSRLEEAYPGRWSLQYGSSGKLWVVNIQIRNR